MLELMKPINLRVGGFFTEVVGIATSRKRLRQLFQVSLYSNAFYLMAANAMSSISGFIFWIIAARLYPTASVGQASATIAAIGLLASFAGLGLGSGLIRFLPGSGEKSAGLLNASFNVSILASLLASLVFLGGLGLWSPALLFLRRDPLLIAAFIAFTAALTLRNPAGQALIAGRRAGFVLAREAIFNVLRVSLVVLLAGMFHAFGIFGAWGISLGVALLANIVIFLPRAQPGYRPRPAIGGEIKGIIAFSFGNYVADLLQAAPGLVLTIIVINLSGAEDTAYFSIAWSLMVVVTMIAESTSLSLFAEGSREEAGLARDARRSLKLIFLMLLPAVALVTAFADKLLLAFGGAYSQNATALLRLLALSALPMAVNTVYLYVKRVEKKLFLLTVVTALLGAMALALSYALVPVMGITGTGIAWLISQGTVALVITASFIKKHF